MLKCDPPLPLVGKKLASDELKNKIRPSFVTFSSIIIHYILYSKNLHAMKDTTLLKTTLLWFSL